MWTIISIIRALFTIISMVLWMLGYGVTLIFKKHSKDRALGLRHHWIKYAGIPILGVKIEVEGSPQQGSALYVANHRSFNDPLVICHYLRAFVIAKAEVASYPIINQGAMLTGVLYVKREDKNSRSNVREMMVDTIKSGHSVLVFPEGTVGTQQGVLDFKKGSFLAAFENNIPIVPIAIEYKSEKDLWTQKSFVAQLIQMYSKPKTEVRVRFGLPLSGTDGIDLSCKAEDWITQEMFEMQKNWSKIDFTKKYE